MTCSEPVAQRPPDDWEHIELYKDVREALFSVPTYFHTETSIEGISATDIFTLSSALGATIESQVVATLNQMRAVWDPNERYQLYSFVRQSQTFPDVLLRKSSATTTEEEDIILGIELKGWYLLAKEREPSFRFQVTPAACAVQDLIVVVPWVLSNVISGTPRLFAPYIESAKYAAEYRNYHWSVMRDTTSAKGIKSPESVSPYPTKSDQISDKPKYDSGSNFGRFARTGIMDHYLARVRQEELCGIRAEHWLSFFKIFQEKTGDEDIRSALKRFRHRAAKATDVESDNGRTKSVFTIIDALESLFDI